MPSLRGPNPSNEIGARLDRLPASRFHFVLLGIAAVSLLFDGLDGVVMTFVLSTAWFAEFSIFYLYQTFVPTILAGEGYAIVKSLGYSVVILGAAIPAFVLGGQIAVATVPRRHRWAGRDRPLPGHASRLAGRYYRAVVARSRAAVCQVARQRLGDRP